MYPKTVLASLLLLCFFNASTQQLIATITPTGQPESIQGMMIGPDIFLAMAVQDETRKWKQHAILVAPSGEQRNLDLTAIGNKPVVAGIASADSTYFYYLNEIDNVVFLSSLVVDMKSGKSVALSNRLPIPGGIFGSYIENGDLFMLCGVKNEYKLRLLQLRKGHLFSMSEFPLTFNLGKKRQHVTFIDMANPVTPQDAAGDVKFCKDGRNIWIIIDEPIDDNDVTVTEASVFRTTVVKLDLDKMTTIVKSFMETERTKFTSTIFRNDVYRLVLTGRTPRVDQFDFATGKKLNSVILGRGTLPDRDSTYARISGRFRTEKDVKSAMVIKRVMGPLFYVDSLADRQVLFTVGHYGDHVLLGGPIMVVPFPVASLVLTASSLIVGKLVEGRLSTVYYYYRGTMDKGVVPDYHVPILRKVVDDYDHKQLMNRVRFEYRGYINQRNVTYEISQVARTKNIEIRRFGLAPFRAAE